MIIFDKRYDQFIQSIRFDLLGDILALAEDGGVVRWLDPNCGFQEIATIETRQYAADIAFTSSGKTAAVIGRHPMDGPSFAEEISACFYKIDSGKIDLIGRMVIEIQDAGAPYISSRFVSEDHSILLIGEKDYTFLDFESQQISKVPAEMDYIGKKTLVYHPETGIASAISCSQGSSMVFWYKNTNNNSLELLGKSDPLENEYVGGAALSPCMEQIAVSLTCEFDPDFEYQDQYRLGRLYLYDFQSRQCLKRISIPGSLEYEFKRSPFGRSDIWEPKGFLTNPVFVGPESVVVGTAGGTILQVDLKTEEVSMIDRMDDEIVCLDFSKRQRFLCACDIDGAIRIWKI